MKGLRRWVSGQRERELSQHRVHRGHRRGSRDCGRRDLGMTSQSAVRGLA